MTLNPDVKSSFIMICLQIKQLHFNKLIYAFNISKSVRTFESEIKSRLMVKSEEALFK